MKLHTLLIATFAIAFANAQDKGADPFVDGKATVGNKVVPPAPFGAEDSESSDPVNMSFCYEDFSLPLAQAAALQREGLTGGQLYAKVIAAAGKDSVRQETFCVLTTKSGQKCTNETVSELIYPTAFEPAKLSDAVTTGVPGTDKDGKAIPAGPLPVLGPVAIARTPATPSAFETRNLGFTFMIEPMFSNHQYIDLRTLVEHVDFAGRSAWGQEFSTVEMPNFESHRINVAVMLKVGEPFLLGTINRPPVSTLDPDSANRVWFAFITAKLAK
jgi:hypothetical protein